MSRSEYSIAPWALSLLLLVGCDSALVDSEDLDTAGKRGGGLVVASVTGSGHAWIDMADPDNPVWRTFTLNAHRRADGSVTGRFGYNSHPGLSRATGRVVCLQTYGNEAVVKVEVDRFDDPNHAAPPSMWFVIRDGSPDTFSPGIPDHYVTANGCDVISYPSGVPFEPADAGDFEVRSSG